MHAPSFFQQQQSIDINLGAQGDGCFLAIAAGFVDTVASSRTGLKKDLSICVKNLLDHYAYYFPEDCSKLTGKSQEELLKQLVAKQSLPYFLKKLAFVIRQLAIDEFLKSLDKDPVLLIMLLGNNSLAELREPTTEIHSAILAAAANALGITICMESVKTIHDIPQILTFNPSATTATKSPVVIMEHAASFSPKVRSPQLFESYQRVDAVSIEWPLMPPLELSLQDKMDAAIKQIIKNFEHHYKRLSTMVRGGNLSLRDLQSLRTSNQCAASEIFYKYLLRYAPPALIVEIEQATHDMGSLGFSFAILETLARDLSLGLIAMTTFDQQLDDLEVPSAQSPFFTA